MGVYFVLKHGRAGGHFAPSRFAYVGGAGKIDEIALNPMKWHLLSTEECLSILVHEMCHQQQQHVGKPSRNGYHNKEWGRMMKAVGLIPSDTGKPDGKQTGQRMHHYIEPGRALRKIVRRAAEGWLQSELSGPDAAHRRQGTELQNDVHLSHLRRECLGQAGPED